MNIRCFLSMLLVVGASAGAMAADRVDAAELHSGAVTTLDYENMTQEEFDKLVAELSS